MSRKTKEEGARRRAKTARLQAIISLSCILTAIAVVWGVRQIPTAQAAAIEPNLPPRYMRYEQVVGNVQQIPQMDIADLNLVCSQNIDDQDELLDLNDYAAQLDKYAARVKSETARYFYKFKQNPQAYENSEAKFRIIMMGVVLCEDFGVHYNQKQAKTCLTASDAEFLSDSRTAFIRGPMDPEIGGNCGSLPVLYAAVSRRLGYPIKLVASQHHLYLRWDAPSEEINIEATSDGGVNFYTDEHFRQIDREINGSNNYTDAEAKAEGYFRPLTPREEAAVAFRQRTQCLVSRGRLQEASHAAGIMTQLSPTPVNKEFTGRLLLAAIHQLDEKAKHIIAVPDLAPASPEIDYSKIP